MSDHIEFGLLDAYALGSLDAAGAARVARHLAGCPSCRREYDEIRGVLDVLPHALASDEAPPHLRDRIWATIDERAPQRSSRGVIAGLAAALMLALIGDAVLASRAFRGDTVVVASAKPSPPRRPAPALPAHSAHPNPRSGSVAATKPSRAASAAAPHATAAPAVAASHSEAVASIEAEVADEVTIAALERRLSAAQRAAGGDRREIAQLQSRLAGARTSHAAGAVLVSPRSSPLPALSSQTVTPAPLVAATASPGTGNDALVTALRTGKVFTIDGAVGGEPWHLTIVQPRDGSRAIVYSGTPSAPAGDTYRTWVVRAGRTVDIGELPPKLPATLEMPMALEPGDVVAFSREPVGGGTQPTQPFLMELTIPQYSQ